MGRMEDSAHQENMLSAASAAASSARRSEQLLKQIAERRAPMTDAQIKHMAERFLAWPLPQHFSPDAGISFNPIYNEGTLYQGKHKPIGTNLFGFTEALDMVRFMIEGLDEEVQPSARPRRPSRDETWLQVAETIAQRGTCPRRQVGCVIVDIHGRVMATGYNGPASGRPHCSEGDPCPGASFPSGEGLDKCEAIHAEQNACLLLNDPWKVDTIYITASPCLSCVKLLLGTSAKRIVYRHSYPHADAFEWWRRSGRELIQLGTS